MIHISKINDKNQKEDAKFTLVSLRSPQYLPNQLANIPAGPDNSIRGHTVGRSDAYFDNRPHFNGINAAAIKTFFVVSLL